jgi:hypothetical protein
MTKEDGLTVFTPAEVEYLSGQHASTDPWKPRGVKVRGHATVEDQDGTLRIRIRPSTVWSWNINEGAPKHFAGAIEKRQVESP